MYKSDFLLDCHAIKILHILKKKCRGISKEKLMKEMGVSEEIFTKTVNALLVAKLIMYAKEGENEYTLAKAAKEISILNVIQAVSAEAEEKWILKNRKFIDGCLENRVPDDPSLYEYLTFKIEKELAKMTIADLNK